MPKEIYTLDEASMRRLSDRLDRFDRMHLDSQKALRRQAGTHRDAWVPSGCKLVYISTSFSTGAGALLGAVTTSSVAGTDPDAPTQRVFAAVDCHVVDPETLEVLDETVPVVNHGSLPLIEGYALVAKLGSNWTVVSRMNGHGFSHNVRRFYNASFYNSGAAEWIMHGQSKLLPLTDVDSSLQDGGPTTASAKRDWVSYDPTAGDVFIHAPGTYMVTYGCTAKWAGTDAGGYGGLSKTPSHNSQKSTITGPTDGTVVSTFGSHTHGLTTAYYTKYVPIKLQLELVVNWNPSSAPYNLSTDYPQIPADNSGARDSTNQNILTMMLPASVSDDSFTGSGKFNPGSTEEYWVSSERTAIVTHTWSSPNWHGKAHCRLNLGVKPFCPGPDPNAGDAFACYVRMGHIWVIIRPIGLGDAYSGGGYYPYTTSGLFQWWGTGTQPAAIDGTGA